MKKMKRLLAILLAAVMSLSGLPLNAFAVDSVSLTGDYYDMDEDGGDPNVEAKDLNQTITDTAGIVETEIETEIEIETETTETETETIGLPKGFSPGVSTRTVSTGTGDDVTNHIIFTNGQLSSSSGTIDQGDDIIFNYDTYTFSIDWAVNFTSLGTTLIAGDYFTFRAPKDLFANKTLDVKNSSGTVMATLTTDADGNGKVTFNSEVENLSNINGNITLGARYEQNSAGVIVDWKFEFNGIYEYQGTSGGRELPAGTVADDNRKQGWQVGSDSRYMSWTTRINIQEDAWTGRVKIEDTLGSDHKMATIWTMDTRLYGYYGLTDYGTVNAHGANNSYRSQYYLGIAVIDWDKMRDDYNELLDWNRAQNNMKILYFTGGTGILDTSAQQRESSYTVPTSNLSFGVSDFMYNYMIETKNDSTGDYLYTTPYTGGLESVIVTDDGFELIFPDEALNKTSLYMRYYTELTSPISPNKVNNTITVSGSNIDDSVAASANVDMKASISGIMGMILLYKYDVNGITPLPDVSFTLEEPDIQYSSEQTTNGGGVAEFTLMSGGSGYAGTYTLKEKEAPGGYMLMDDIILTLNNNGEITHVNGTQISGGATITDKAGDRICQVSSDRLALIVYNDKEETVDVGGIKTWNDANNQDGKRPPGITVNLWADNKVIKSKSVTAADYWKYEWTGLPKYSNGAAITYTVTEDPVTYYSTQISGYNITNNYTPETVNVSGTKTWDDANDQDGIRPPSITVNLWADGKLKDSKFVTAIDDWEYEWTGLAKYNSGSLITYTITEDPVSGYQTTVTGYNITNSHTPGKVSRTVLKDWDDANDQDGIRPGAVQVQLYAGGTVEGSAVTLDKGNGWTYTWDNLPEKKSGQTIVYTVEEVSVPTDYTSDKSEDGFTIINSHTPETVSVSGTKTWADVDNQDGKRPDDITVNLLANGLPKYSESVSASDGWSYGWTGLPKYENGTEIAYTITEDPVSDYQTTVNGYDITNSYTPGKTSRTVLKTWNDANDQDGIRPGSVQVQLYADEKVEGSAVTLNEANGWTHTWNDLPEKQGGQTIVYTVEEVSVPAGYMSDKSADGFTIINSHTPETVDVSGMKTWADADDQDGKRPDDITVNLLANGLPKYSESVSASDGWSYGWTGLPKYENGTEIAYTITEDPVSNYQTTVNGYDITNSYTPGKTSRMVLKTWNDANDQDGIRPGSVQVQLYADKKVEGSAVTLNEANGWTHTWNDLPEKQGGQTIVYMVEEVSVPAGYTSDKSADGFTIINSHTPETVDVSGMKTWSDADDQDGKRPDDITVNLLANGLPKYSESVSASDGWSYGWTGLPKYENGTEIAYTITEDPVSDYQTTVNGYDITNSYTPGKTSRTVLKTWNDANDQDGIRPGSVQVQLYADEKVEGSAVTLNEANGWTHTWNDLPEKQGGVTIVYTVEEVSVPAGYTSDKSADGFTIINNHTPETVDVSGMKTWSDADDQDGKRPDDITVNLLANGLPKYSESVSASDGWSYGWTGLPKYENGTEIAYTITEDPVSDYQTTVNGYDITNSYTPGKTGRTVLKTWNDANDQDGIRPGSVMVQLYAYGKAYGDSVTLNEANGWTHTWNDLPEKQGGATVNYTVEEVNVPEGYTADKSENGFTIINSHTPKKISRTVWKEWYDADDQDGVRPNSIQVQLYAGGMPEGSAVTLNEGNGWTYTWSDLPEKKSGQTIAYTVEEVSVPEGYTADKSENGFTIINSHTPETVDVSGMKTWADADDQDGKRPDDITVNLLANGLPKYSESVSASDGWSYGWTGLPKYENGTEIAYTITEDPVSDYQTTVNGYDITNSYTPGKTSRMVLKTWNDANDQDGIRPGSVQVQLYADEKVEGSAVTLNEANGWTHTWNDLPEKQGGQTIVYMVEEVSVPAGYTSDKSEDGFTIINSHTPETVEVSGTKTWADADDQDGKRPDDITVNLLANGLPKYSESVSASDGWSYGWTNLPKYENGTEIAYTITEDPVSDYQTTINVYDITNSYTPGETSRTVVKAWEDGDDQDGIRPGSVQAQLYADGKAYGAHVTLNEANGWTHTWNNLPEKHGGQTVDYAVEEVNIPTGYTVSYSGTEGFTIINSHTPETVDVSGTKTWDDADDQDGKRPDDITVNLLANGLTKDSKTISEADDWSYGWTELPKYESGVEITYTVTEDPVSDYQTTINVYDITNSYTPGETSRTVVKAWEDANDQDGKRPNSVRAQLYADGKTYGDAVTLNEANDWTHTWNNLPEKQGGQQVTYTVEEVSVPTDYTEGKSGDGFTIINSYTPETISISGTKSWDDANDQDGKRPDNITVNLLANGLPKDSKRVSATESWSYSWTDLPKYENGVEISYAVTEDPVSDYQTTISGYNITNSYTPGETSRTVVKAWEDVNDYVNIRPDMIQVQLYANGKTYGDAVTLNEANDWIHTWNNLPERQNGRIIVYTVEEMGVPEGYVVSYSEDGFVITNTSLGLKDYEVTDISGTKTWDDDNDRNGKRPDSITVNLFANGTLHSSKTVTADDEWKYEWTGLLRYEYGVEIQYTITENPVTDYSTEVNGYNITNTYTPGETSRTVKKIWNDNKDSDGIRPKSIKVQLYADGTAVGDAIKLNADNNWKHTWSGLAESEDGETVVYTVKEVSVPAGYKVSYSSDTFVITNKHNVTKNKDDDGNDGNGSNGNGSNNTTFNKTTSINPKTGDYSNIVIWSLLLMAACAALISLLYFFRKDRIEK